MEHVNAYEERARERKVGVIVAFLVAQLGPDLDLETLAALKQAQRNAIAKAAGVRTPSEVTWDRVVELVQRVAGRPRVADPFARFD